MGNTTSEGNQFALQNAQNAFGAYQSGYDNWAQQYDQYRQQANHAFGQGLSTANQQLAQGAAAAQNQAQLASRQAGLSKGQAAMNAAGASNQMYQNNFAPVVNNATQQRLGAAQNQQANAMQGMGMASSGMQGAMGTQAQVGANQKSAFDKSMSGAGLGAEVAGGIASGIAMFSDADVKQDIDPVFKDSIMKRLDALMSDERIKEPIKEPSTDDMIAEVAEMINNYTYHYKPGVGEDPSVEYSGVMAQELLQVDGYRSCVFEDADGILKVDTGRLALVNAGVISDLSKRLLLLESFIESVMSGLQEQNMPDIL